MKQTCRITRKEFEITDEDLAFYQKINVPPPTLCPEERERRRWSWRDKDFFIKKCDKCNERVMSWFSPDLPVITYCETCYRSEEFEALEYGRDFDFNRPFFEQFEEMMKLVPRHTSNALRNENSKYIISAHKNQNCYFIDEIDECRDCYFGFNIQFSKNIVEGIYIRESEICYDLIKGENCHSVFYSKNIFNCSNSAFLMNCRGCKNCLFSTNLRNKEYYLFNQPVSKESYEEAWKSIFTGSHEKVNLCRAKFEEFLKKQPFPAGVLVNCEDSTGDYLSNCKNVKETYCTDNSRDCKFCSDIHYSKDCYDVNIYEGELMYESTHVGPKSYGQFFTQLGWFSSNLQYCIDVHGCKNLFGCMGLKKKEYCIFNKQYSKEEYETLLPKIIEHMRKTKEYGEFFPMEISPYPYNHTMAQRFFPLTKEEVLKRGWKWMDEKEDIKGTPEAEIPDSIHDIPDDIHKKIFVCTKTGKKFHFTEAEIRFYKTHGIPVPTVEPNTRIENLWKKMNPRKLNDRSCSKCQIQIQTALPSSIEQVMCEECYLGTVR